ncbi:MAG: AbrB family transcriptional regulator [Paracoccaceae bacterium]
MAYLPRLSDLWVTFYTIAIGAAGAFAGYLLGLPVFLLTGPAIAVSAIGLAGFRFAITPLVRDVTFIFIGIGIGSGVDAHAAAAFLSWPLAFLFLGIMLVVTMISCKTLLRSVFGFEQRSAILAASPGHLSFVISMSESLDLDITKIAIVQSVRLLALTLCVPFVALFFGLDVGRDFLPAGPTMPIHLVAALFSAALVFGLILKRLKVPAALLIGAMVASALAHLSDWTPGVLAPPVTNTCFVVMGTLIGTRFSGISISELAKSLSAGLCTTALTVLFALIAALPTAILLGMPITHVLVAFAPGGLETMIVMGAFLGANPGFVAACHVGRLLVLTVLVPAMLNRTTMPETGTS